MKALKLGEVEDFPFVDAPSARAIADGYQLLAELNAVDEQRRLTPIGSQLAKLPVDPRMARMIVAARDEGCLAEILIIASGLAIPDPRDRPLDKQELADTAHAQFQDERSEFLGLLKLWAFFDDALKHKKSNRKLAQACRDHFLSHVRLREWRDLHGQLHALVSEMGWHPNEKPANQRRRSTARCWPGCSATSAASPMSPASISVRVASSSLSSRARLCARRARPG